jgi:hypothetical protein
MRCTAAEASSYTSVVYMDRYFVGAYWTSGLTCAFCRDEVPPRNVGYERRVGDRIVYFHGIAHVIAILPGWKN